jgi:hypothetical protein
MIEISIKSDVERVFKTFAHVSQAELAKATARALNRVISSARSVSVKEIRKKYNIDPKYLKEKIGDKENRYNALKAWKANPNNLTATLKAYGKPIPLIAFPITQTDQGVEVSVIKGQTKLIPSAFIATTKSGHRSVFARGKYGQGAFIFRNKRIRPFPAPDLPITQLSTTSIQTAIVTPSILTAMKLKVETDFPKRLEHEISYLLSKR